MIWTMMSQKGGNEKCYQKSLEDIILMSAWAKWGQQGL